MARPQQEPMRALVNEEQNTLQKVARGRSEAAEVVARAKSLLAVAGGAGFAAGARAGGRKSGYGVGKLVRRFNRDGVQALQTRPGTRTWCDTGVSIRKGKHGKRVVVDPDAEAKKT